MATFRMGRVDRMRLRFLFLLYSGALGKKPRGWPFVRPPGRAPQDLGAILGRRPHAGEKDRPPRKPEQAPPEAPGTTPPEAPERTPRVPPKEPAPGKPPDRRTR
jgi:hypothetical protein